jgi:hypothetical protein
LFGRTSIVPTTRPSAPRRRYTKSGCAFVTIDISQQNVLTAGLGLISHDTFPQPVGSSTGSNFVGGYWMSPTPAVAAGARARARTTTSRRMERFFP